MLRASTAEVLRSADAETSAWLHAFDAALDVIVQEPVVYLMGKRL
jgi:hypothetical protein